MSAGGWLLRNPWPASGYTLMSWATRLAMRARSSRAAARSPSGSGPCRLAGHDRTRPGQQLLGIGGAAAIVAAGGGKPATRGQRQGIAPAHAEPEHPDPAGAPVLAGQPGPGGLGVV